MKRTYELQELEALRSVDRHGVTKRGEQYRGLKQLAAGDGPINSQEAAAFVSKCCPGSAARTILEDPEAAEFFYREAAKTLHPDKGGDSDDWNKLQRAMVILREPHGVAA